MSTKFFHYLTITLLLFSVILRPDPGFADKPFKINMGERNPAPPQSGQRSGQENPKDIVPKDIVPIPGRSHLRVLVNVKNAKVTLITKHRTFTGTSNFAMPYDQPNFPSGPAKLRLEVKGFDLIERDIVVPDRSKVTEIFKFVSLEKTFEVIEEIEKISIPEDPEGTEIKIEPPPEVETTQEVKEEKEAKSQTQITASTPPTEHQIIEGSSYLNITISRWDDAFDSFIGAFEILVAAYEKYIILIDDKKIGEFNNASGSIFNHKVPLSKGKHDIEIIYKNYAIGVLPTDEKIYKNTIVIEDNGSELKLFVMKDFK